MVGILEILEIQLLLYLGQIFILLDPKVKVTNLEVYVKVFV